MLIFHQSVPSFVWQPETFITMESFSFLRCSNFGLSFACLKLFQLQMMDPGHLSNWTVTHVDWSEGKWHPKAYEKVDVTEEILLKIKVDSIHKFGTWVVRESLHLKEDFVKIFEWV